MNALNKYNTRFLLLLLPLIACSCSRKDIFSYEELYNGTVPISLDWQGITPDEQPDMQVHIWGTHISDAREEISKDTLFSVNPGTAPHLCLLEAEYDIVVWNEPENIRFDGKQFHLQPDENGFLPEPEAVYAGNSTFEVTAGQQNEVVIKIQPYTRVLTLNFRMNAQAQQRIEDITAVLEGIVATKNLSGVDNDEIASGRIALEFVQKAPATRSATASIKYVGKKHLLGIQPEEEQKLTITLAYTNGEEEIIEQDLSSILSDFNNFGSSAETDNPDNPDNPDDEDDKGDFNLSTDISFAGAADGTIIIEDWVREKDTDLDANN